MRFPGGDRIGRYSLLRATVLRVTVILGLLAGFVLSPKLWLSSRLYPLTPVWSFLQPLRSPGDYVVIFAFRPAAFYCGIAMHVFILLVLGPVGHRFNVVIWPWNLAMIVFLFILFFRRTEEPALRDIVWGRGFMFQKVALILFGVMPALSFLPPLG